MAWLSDYFSQKTMDLICYACPNRNGPSDPVTFHHHGLTLIPTWMSNHMPGRMWDTITKPFPNFNNATVEVLEWISDFIPHFLNRRNYLSMLWLKSIHRSTRGFRISLNYHTSRSVAAWRHGFWVQYTLDTSRSCFPSLQKCSQLTPCA